MLITEEIPAKPQRKESDRHLPKIIKWNGVNIIRNQSFLATIKEIIEFSDEIDLTRIGIIGDPHSGKTTLGKTIAHCIHKISKTPYSIRFFEKDDLINFKETLASLTPVNHILVFGDISFMGGDTNKRQIEMIKQTVTKIRHLPGGKDVKIIILSDYHYLLGLDKYLRMADYKYITTVGSSEGTNLLNMTDKKYSGLIQSFRKYRKKAVTKKVWKIRISDKEYLPYKYRNPFIPVLFYNEDSLRLIISPTREWIDPICSKCSEAEGKLETSDITIEEFAKQGENNFGKGNWLSAIRLELYINGYVTQGKHIVQALRAIQKGRFQRKISLEQLGAHYDMTPTITRLRKPIQTELIPTIKS